MEKNKFRSRSERLEDISLKLVLFSLFVLLGSILMAQSQIANDMEVFAENGENFTLYVNGQQVNEEPASYVKIKNTHHNSVHVRIELEDKHKSVIKRESLMIGIPGTGNADSPIAAVFMIKKRMSIFKKRRYKVRATIRSLKKIQSGPPFVVHHD